MTNSEDRMTNQTRNPNDKWRRQASPGVTPTETEACPERSRMGVSPWSLLFVVCLSPICAFLCVRLGGETGVLCGLCVETRRLLSVAGGAAGGKAGWGGRKCLSPEFPLKK